MPTVESELGTEQQIKKEILILKEKIKNLNIPLYDKNVEKELEKLNDELALKYKNFFALKKHIFDFKNEEYRRVKDNYVIKIRMMIDRCNICLEEKSIKNLKEINKLYWEAKEYHFMILHKNIGVERKTYIKEYLLELIKDLEFYKKKSYGIFEEKIMKFVEFERLFLQGENIGFADILVEIIEENFREEFFIPSSNNRIDKPDLFFNFLKNELIYWAGFLTPYFILKGENLPEKIREMVDRLMNLIHIKLFELKKVESVQKYDLVLKFCLSFKEFSHSIYSYFKIKIKSKEIAQFLVENKQRSILSQLDSIHENLVNVKDMRKDYIKLLNETAADINIYYTISTDDYNIANELFNYLTKHLIIFNNHFIESINLGKIEVFIALLNNVVDYKMRLYYLKYKLMMIFPNKNDCPVQSKSINTLIYEIVRKIISHVKYDFEDNLNFNIRYEKLNNREEKNIVDMILRELLLNFTFLKQIVIGSYRDEFKIFFLRIFNEYVRSDIQNLNEVGEKNLNLLITKFRNEINQI